ncbi:MAG: type II secretion system protein, partial [Sulfurospirillum sp.]
MRNAFTMIELIITMVILSIVSYIASGLIAKTYIGYNQTNAVHKANLKVENAISFIVNRLEYAIDGTVVKRKSATDASISSIDEAPDDYEVLEWVGYDKDGFEANDKIAGSYNERDQSAWSGFCDIK